MLYYKLYTYWAIKVERSQFFTCHILWKTSLYTTLVVVFWSCPWSPAIKILIPPLFVTLDSATYSWPWLNTGLGRNKPTCDNVCPWLLLMVIAKETIRGNCRLWNLTAKVELDGTKVNLGMNTWSPKHFPVRILQFSTCLLIWMICSLVNLGIDLCF